MADAPPGPSAVYLQFAYRAKSVDGVINLSLYYILQHMDGPNTYAHVLFVDLSSSFNTIILDHLLDNL